jgi:hypothetical protein
MEKSGKMIKTITFAYCSTDYLFYGRGGPTHLRNWIQLPSIWKGKNTHNHIDSPSDLRSSAVEADIPAQQRIYTIQNPIR